MSRTPARRLLALTTLTALAALSLAQPANAVGPTNTEEDQTTVHWVALGDSYTAGVFVGEPIPGLGSSDRDGCDRTYGSYPVLADRALRDEPITGKALHLMDVSCGGATIDNIAGTGQTPISPVEPPENGWPQIRLQVERANLDETTGLVTIGAGGNSMPFAAMLMSCLIGGYGQPDEATPCRDAYEAGGPIFDPESISDKYDRITREYAAMLNEVMTKAPNAKVVTVGYPTVAPEDPSGCDRTDTTQFAANIKGLGTMSITHGDIAWFHDVTTHLNTIIEAITKLSGGTYVDVQTSSKGHDVCQSSSVKWVEGVCGHAAEYWPDTVSLGAITLECERGNKATLVHPNAREHANAAKHVEAAIRRVLS